MDCKYTKQNVTVSKPVFKQTLEQPVDSDFTLPDYCPDIRRILKCRVVPKISQKSAEGGSVTVDGIANVNLIYSDEENGIRTYDLQIPFSKSADFGGDWNSCIISAVCRTEYCNCRAVTERRVEIHASISIALCVTANEDTEILTDIDEPSVQMLRGSAPSSNTKGFCEKYLIMNDELSLPDKNPAIRNILRSDAGIVIRDKKIIGSKIVVKGDLVINILYFGEETERCESFSDSIPFSQILDIEGINDDCTCVCDSDLISLELHPRTGMSGDVRVISINAKLYLCATAYCNAEVPFIFDAYSTKYDINLEYQDLGFQKVIFSANEPYLIKQTLDIPSDSVSTVIDMWSTAHMMSVTESDNGIIVKGNCTFCLIALDSGGEPAYYERTFDFDDVFDSGELPPKCEFKANITVVGADCIVGSDGIEAKAELAVSVDVIEHRNEKVICNAELGDEKQRRFKPSSVIVYFASKGEKLWDIASQYDTSVDAISAVNSLSDDVLSDNKTLVIPSV